jgi:polyphosphate kinase 2 (PPK2 family)
METNDQKQFEIDGSMVSLDELIKGYTESKTQNDAESKGVSKRENEQALKPYQAELIKLQKHIEDTNQKMIILFEGRDAAGKGGTIRRITRYMNEKHYRIVALGKPTEEQKSQWFYQKYVSYFPRGGEIVLFDRSWYNRAMVESVFGFCTQKEYDDFMKGVKGFERDLTRQRRKTDPLRQWKLSEIDVQAQDRWDDFTETKYNMLKRTHSHNAPWTVIRSNDKQDARFEALKVILNSINYEGRDETLDYSLNPDVVISGAREIEIMDAQISRNGKFIG